MFGSDTCECVLERPQLYWGDVELAEIHWAADDAELGSAGTGCEGSAVQATRRPRLEKVARLWRKADAVGGRLTPFPAGIQSGAEAVIAPSQDPKRLPGAR